MSQERELQLVCLPFAGGGASFFNEWQSLSDKLDIIAVQLPGREKRFCETPHTSVAAAIDSILPELLEQLHPDKGVAVFGHSLGAVLAYELTHRLAALPEVFVVGLVASGSPDPWSPREERATGQADDEFLRRVSLFSGYSHTALDNPTMREMLLPILRADVEMHENYSPLSDAPLDVPVIVVRGSDDALVAANQIEGWRKATRVAMLPRELPGGHMYLTESPRALLGTIESAFF